MKSLFAMTAACLALATSAPVLAQDAGPDFTDPALVARGAVVANAGDCAACHRAVETHGAPYVGGYKIASPLGDIVAPNITPSKSAGIGGWSFADFDNAMRKGKRPDGANLYPAMPYTDYQGISTADMQALYAYFMHGVKPVDTKAAETHLPFPFGIRMLMGPWNWLFTSDKPFKATANLSPEAQRGQYLVETLGHCGSCHTPRNMLMAEKPSEALGGADLSGWHAPNITSDPISGIGGWSQADLVAYLRDGRAPGKGIAAGGMAEAVEHSLQHLPEADLVAIAAYLKASQPIRDPRDTRPAFGWTETRPVKLAAYEPGNGATEASYSDSSTTDGAFLYDGACASCHGMDGKGTKDHFYPPLVGSVTTGAVNPANLVMTILGGVDRESGVGHAFMPAFANQMTDEQIAAVANHVLQRFGRPDTLVTKDMVATARAGGGKPLLLKIMPWLMGLAAAVFAALSFFAIRRGQRRAARRTA
ncbi:cytochrome c [Novosphingobium sp. 9]|uniref:cytochrome c n=1 Tax=Novosphingobium sp. 9 TaxID=2025349 RepID=UPI0021B51BFA|nr:cytochrome c [Novosphingobium sp. 9]